MLQADAYQLRFLAQKYSAGAENIRRSANRLQTIAQSVLQGSDGWQGEGAQAFLIKSEFLQNEVMKASTTLDQAASILQSLAMRVEMINSKKQQLLQLQHQRDSLHVGMNAGVDAEIAYLEGRIVYLQAEVEAESLYADTVAATELRAIQINEIMTDALHQLVQEATAVTKAVKNEVIPALEASWEEVEDDFEKYGKKIAYGIWNGIKELFDIPEIVDAWDKMTNPNSSWEDRLLGAGILVGEAAIDVSTLFGIGDVAKGVELLAKFGLKYGAKLMAEGGIKKAGEFLAQGAGQMVRVVGNGMIRLSRGFSADFAYVGASGDVRGGFSLYQKAKDTFIRFSSKLNDKASEVIRAYRGLDLREVEQKYLADPKLVVDMPFKGKGVPGTNAEGWMRDYKYYFKTLLEQRPEIFSKRNTALIKNGESPINDLQFRKNFPQYDLPELHDNKLIHHHIGGGGQAVAVPQKLHMGFGGIHNVERALRVTGRDKQYSDLLQRFIDQVDREERSR